MLQVARLAPSLLAEAAPRVRAFLEGQLTDDGGARDREGKSDLYYTAFLLDALIALQADLPRDRVRAYLEGFGMGEELDLVHRACLVRCWAALDDGWPEAGFAARVTLGLEPHRCEGGGFATEPGGDETLYAAFLALGMYQDLRVDVPEPARLARSFDLLRTDDGAYANGDLPMGTTPSTAAAAAVLTQIGHGVPPGVGPWLLKQQHESGGFLAMPEAPLPDLLSTATALHALSALGLSVGEGRERALDFLDTLWTGESFCGSWADDVLDCEYAFYALLALGHLSVET
jgi:hypothetical protein